MLFVRLGTVTVGNPTTTPSLLNSSLPLCRVMIQDVNAKKGVTLARELIHVWLDLLRRSVARRVTSQGVYPRKRCYEGVTRDVSGKPCAGARSPSSRPRSRRAYGSSGVR